MQRPPIEQSVTFVFVADLAATHTFYTQVLGLSLTLDQGSCRIYHVAASAYLGFCERAGASPNGVMLTLVTHAVDAWHSFLTAQNIIIEKPPTFNAQYNIYHLFVRDPDGYLVEIQEFRDPAWPGNAANV